MSSPGGKLNFHKIPKANEMYKTQETSEITKLAKLRMLQEAQVHWPIFFDIVNNHRRKRIWEGAERCSDTVFKVHSCSGLGISIMQ